MGGSLISKLSYSMGSVDRLVLYLMAILIICNCSLHITLSVGPLELTIYSSLDHPARESAIEMRQKLNQSTKRVSTCWSEFKLAWQISCRVTLLLVLAQIHLYLNQLSQKFIL